ncbi:ATP-binding protein [Actinoplanes sp. DH11]|uniref:ATP-binding protein n=1 Tax=Actinoplanes sp. DH11 TaxID=2857011 RepID=UPI001E4D0612|nr:ATP-binding protein [Actinoplanes sp. DH11]
MTEEERAALAALRFNWAPVPDDVWRPLPFHVDGLHAAAVRDVLDGVADARASSGASPIGLVVQGQRGSGKTHLLGWTRQQVQDQEGYFFLVSLLDAAGFWDSVLTAILDGLSRPVPGGGETQLRLLLKRLSAMVGAPRTARRAVMGETELTRAALDAFIEGLGAFDRHVARASQETARALALSASDDVAHRDLAENYFVSGEESVPGERNVWGMRRAPRHPQLIVQDLSWLLALTGPSVIAIDQIDTLIAQSAAQADPALAPAMATDPVQALMLAQLAEGLMSLRQFTRRTLTVVACLPTSWTIIRNAAADTVGDRFRLAPQLTPIHDDDLGRAIIEKRFTLRYAEVGFQPPYPSWPVRPEAFAQAGDYTPRQLLIEIDRHVRACVTAGEIRELDRLGEPVEPPPGRTTTPVPSPSSSGLDALDARFAELTKNAGVSAVLNRTTEDSRVPPLLAAGLTAWILERGGQGTSFTVDPPPSTDPPLHARIRLTLDERIEDQVHWCFRAVSDDHHAVAALARLRKACVAAALDPGVPKRKLFLLRNTPWSGGAKTRAAVTAFEQAGGRTLALTEDDLRALSALQIMLDEGSVDLQGWLAERRPTAGIAFLQRALADAATWTAPAQPAEQAGPEPQPRAVTPNPPATAPHPPATTPHPPAIGPHPQAAVPKPQAAASEPQAAAAPPGAGAKPQPAGLTTAVPQPAGVTTAEPQPAGVTTVKPQPADVAAAGSQPAGVTAAATIDAPGADAGEPGFTVGHDHGNGAPVRLPVEALRKHATIFAGSGSGKTVLIRRIVEECALQGVSAIVLDPNNDLARLGEGWPEPPPAWRAGDAAKAADYLAHTDVVIWTPRRAAGRPLSFQPLPDFRSVRDDPDEFAEAVEAAVASLAPRAMVTGRANKAHLGLAVLRKTIEHYGRRGGSRLQGLIDTLADLPDGIIDLDDADKIGLGLAQTLTAAMVNDPLFGGDGTPMDPGLLLTPAPGKRARVSVISLIGLPSDDVRQSFVNQLQMALFAWIKKNPAGDRPLLGLLIMDEAQTFAPSGTMTACTQSTLALAAQARKYGLGLIFATQAPKGLHNRIPGNAATQFYGLMNSPIQIEAAREMAKAKGGDVPDISRLTAGEFYFAAEGGAPRKIRTPLSLTHHPRSPLTTEEVIARAVPKPAADRDPER